MDFFERYAKYLKHLVWPGVTLVTAGLVSGSMLNWTLLPLTLLFTGLLLIGSGIYFGSSTVGGFWRRRSTQASTNALIATVALIVIVGLVNFLAVRYLGRLDLTENQLFTLAPQSQTLVQELAQPVRVVVFDRTTNPQDEQLLKSYRRQNPDAFSFEYIDPVADPVTSRQFGVQTAGEIYLVVGETRQLVQRISPDERLSERQLTNELDQITRDRGTVVYVLQGHGEYAIDGSEAGLFEAITALGEKNYTVNPLNFDEGAFDPVTELLEDPDALLEPDTSAETEDLENPEAVEDPAVDSGEDASSPEEGAAPRIPDDADVVILAGPQQALFDSEVKALETYLDNGGNALIMVDPNSPSGIESLLAGWGVTLDGGLVIDTSGTGQLVGLGPAAPLVTQYGDHPITQDFANNRSFFPVVQPLSVGEVPGITSKPLLFTAAQSQLGTISASGDLDFDPATAEQGPFMIGVALNRTVEVTPISQSEPEVPENAADVADADVPDSSDATITPDVSDIEAVEPDAEAVAEAPPTEETVEPDAESADPVPSEAAPIEPEAVDPEAAAEGEAVAESDPETAESAAEPPEEEVTEADAEATNNAEDSDAEDSAEPEADVAETNGAETADPDAEMPEAPELAESRLVVIGNSSFATDGLFTQQLNGDVFLNAVSWLSQASDATLSISPKETTNRRILMTPQQQVSVAAFSLLILPLAGIVGAIVMWLRRR